MARMKAIMARRRRPLDLIYAPEVRDHLRGIEPKHHRLIRDKIEEQLRFDPEVETRNRKPLRQPAALAAEWEIRFGPNNCFRVFYAVDRSARSVQILAIGVKDGERLVIGGEEVEL